MLFSPDLDIGSTRAGPVLKNTRTDQMTSVLPLLSHQVTPLGGT